MRAGWVFWVGAAWLALPLQLCTAESPTDVPLAPQPTFQPQPLETPTVQPPEALLPTPFDVPTGYAGPSGIRPWELQTNDHFIPIEDRWRIGFPDWDRYDKGHPPVDDYPYQPGRWWDPFNLNLLKGDYPILGQHTFLDITATNETIFNPHQIPTGTTPFESTARPFTTDFFGRPNQLAFANELSLSFDLFHGDAAFKPVDWRIKVTPVFNVNEIWVDELGVVNPDIRKGTSRSRTYGALEEWFLETKIADLSADYDFLSIRLGSQPFTSDFRGFIFSDTNRAVRVFGTAESNRDQFNLAFFDQLEKDTNSFLNTFKDRHQYITVANFYRQDFIWPGYTAQLNMVYDHDEPTFHFDQNHFLVRPDPVGVFTPHQVDAFYLGWTGDGHIGPYNITHAVYWALGYDSLNELANQSQNISAAFAAVEVSYDRDWTRFRTSFLFGSGDSNPNNKHATGFDSVFENPNFAGGEFSYWQSQAIPLFGVNLTNRGSLLADLRSSKIQGQANFVNPGILIFNAGIDFDITPKLKLINNINFLWFDETAPLQVFTFDGNIHHSIGTDASMGVEYRPLLSNNIILEAGVSTLIPGRGFRDLYDRFDRPVHALVAGMINLRLQY